MRRRWVRGRGMDAIGESVRAQEADQYQLPRCLHMTPLVQAVLREQSRWWLERGALISSPQSLRGQGMAVTTPARPTPRRTETLHPPAQRAPEVRTETAAETSAR